MSTKIDLYITVASPVSPAEVGELEQMLVEGQGNYHYTYTREGDSIWALVFETTIDQVKMFMEGFYAKQFLTNTISRAFSLYIVGQSKTAQLLIQMNTQFMVDYMNANNETDAILINEELKELGQKMNGMDEFNKRNGLYAFKYVVETLLDNLSEQGLLRNHEGIKKTMFKANQVH